MSTLVRALSALENLCGEGAQYYWTCLNEDEAGESLCKGGDKCAWCEARDALCDARAAIPKATGGQP